MKVAIIPIGNSRGVRLPKPILDQLGFGEEAELEIEDGRLTLAPIAAARRGWAEMFASDPPQDLTAEDEAWLEAPLSDDEEP